MAAFIAVESRDPVPPPELARDTPVADVVHPLKVGLFPVLRNKADLSIFDNFYRFVRERFDLYEPLFGEVGFDYGVAPVTVANRVYMFIGLFKEAKFVKILNNFLPGLVPAQSLIYAAVFINYGVFVHYYYLFKVVPLPHFKVIGIVSGSDLYKT